MCLHVNEWHSRMLHSVFGINQLQNEKNKEGKNTTELVNVMANWQVIKRQGGVSKGNWGKREGINESCGLCGKEEVGRRQCSIRLGSEVKKK